MASYGGPRQSCPITEQCSEWIFQYLGDCVCTMRDSFSFALGLASVASWGVAEVPQILTNFFSGNTEGVSLAFLLTWTFGDIFNLLGCYLEPATLPTQFYMAVLYTITTVVLVGQSVWYEVIFPKRREVEALKDEETREPEVVVERRPEVVPTPSITVPLSRKSSSKDIFITSARSLASSYTPTLGSFVPGSGGHGGHSMLSHSPGQGQPHVASHHPNMHVSRALVAGALILGGLRMGTQLELAAGVRGGEGEPFVFGGAPRRLLQISLGNHQTLQEGGGSQIGQIMGWCMAAIYMGGRLPQIWLNIQRGTVEGLSPLMFLFALVGNATYVASILVRSVEWADLRPNMAWLVDAGVCVLLDVFILCQFVYYSLKNKDEEELDDDYSLLK